MSHHHRRRWPAFPGHGLMEHVPRTLPRGDGRILLRFTLRHGWEVSSAHLWGIHYLTPWAAWRDARQEQQASQPPPGSASWSPGAPE